MRALTGVFVLLRDVPKKDGMRIDGTDLAFHKSNCGRGLVDLFTLGFPTP